MIFAIMAMHYTITVKREAHRAGGAHDNIAAAFALHKNAMAAPIEKNNCLLFF